MTEVERLEHYIAVLQAAVDHEGVSDKTRRSILDLLVSLRNDLEAAKRKAIN
jgi:hypothetical protein